MCYDNEEWCKICEGIDLPVQNWHEEFNKFLPEHSKISKICTLMETWHEEFGKISFTGWKIAISF